MKTLYVNWHNTGNEPITRNDFDGYPSIDLGENSEILSAPESRTDGTPKNADTKWDHSTVTLQPMLLNEGASISISIVLKGSTDFDKIKVGGHIVGVKKLPRNRGLSLLIP